MLIQHSFQKQERWELSSLASVREQYKTLMTQTITITLLQNHQAQAKSRQKKTKARQKITIILKFCRSTLMKQMRRLKVQRTRPQGRNESIICNWRNSDLDVLQYSCPTAGTGNLLPISKILKSPMNLSTSVVRDLATQL